jgi:hypothetical protein
MLPKTLTKCFVQSFFAVLILLQAPPGHTTSAVPLSLSDLVQYSDLTVWGKVTHVYTYWRDHRIYTEALLRVDHTLARRKVFWPLRSQQKSPTHIPPTHASTFTQPEYSKAHYKKNIQKLYITTLGGSIGDIGQWVEGAGRLAIDDEMIVHANWHGPTAHHYVPRGMAQGIWHIEYSRKPSRHQKIRVHRDFPLPLLPVNAASKGSFLLQSFLFPMQEEPRTMPEELHDLLQRIADLTYVPKIDINE